MHTTQSDHIWPVLCDRKSAQALRARHVSRLMSNDFKAFLELELAWISRCSIPAFYLLRTSLHIFSCVSWFVLSGSELLACWKKWSSTQSCVFFKYNPNLFIGHGDIFFGVKKPATFYLQRQSSQLPPSLVVVLPCSRCPTIVWRCCVSEQRLHG